MEWILFSQREPEKIKYSFYEVQIETNTDNFGKLILTQLIFWGGHGWNIYERNNIFGGYTLPTNYFEINKPIMWREFRAPNLSE